MQKIACIFSFKLSSWVSCQKIVFNLHKAYQLNPERELLNFNYSVDQTAAEILESANAIIAAKPDVIVILDHKPHPLAILQLVLPHLDYKPRIIFHIFGDFTLHYSRWDKVGKIIKDFPADFLVASDRQKHLIDKFLPKPLESKVCPFPVDRHEFFYNEALRKIQREEWGLEEDDFAFVFTGRLSRQKRTHTLLKSFNDFLSNTKNKNAHLYFYGTPDHVGDQFIGLWESEGEYFRKISRIYKGLPLEVQKRIHFMGGVPNAELKAVYQGADMLVNLSVHNDEDFGMSVAEAQCSGLPSILTDWGGLASFKHAHLPEATTFIPVKIGIRSKKVHYGAVLEAFENAVKKGHSTNREEISKAALNRFDVEAGHKIIDTLLTKEAPPFTEFTDFFKKVLAEFLYTSTPYLTEQKTINHLYREIYSSYVRNN